MQFAELLLNLELVRKGSVLRNYLDLIFIWEIFPLLVCWEQILCVSFFQFY